MTATTIKDIRGITYLVLLRHTPADYEAMQKPGLARLAADMRQHNQTARLVCKRPNGRREYLIGEWNIQGVTCYDLLTALS